MKTLKLTIASLAFLVAISGCKKQFDADVVNKNLPITGISPSLLLPPIEQGMFIAPFGDEEKAGQFTAINYTYYGSNQYWTGSAGFNYGTLNNVVAMETEAGKLTATLSKPYLALAKFFRAYYFVSMSLKVGDVPMTEALQGLKNSTPAYDKQKQIFINALALLESANTDFGDMNSVNALTSGTYSIPATYDIYFAGDLTKWQKIVNAFRLRVLIALSKRTGTDADLNVASQFSAILSNPAKYPLMTSMDDNLQHIYDGVFSIYPNSPRNYGNDATRDNMAATYLNTLASLKDLRALEVAEPARGLGFADTSYSSFVGGASGQALSAMAQLIQQQKISLIGRHRYYETLTGENTFIMSYPEMCLNIAEGINRGWATGDAEAWYKNGVNADLGFYGVKNGANSITFQKSYFGILYDDITYTVHFSYDGYYNQPAVKYAGNNVTGLNQILTQKYLAFARNSGLEAYYQWRRTGVPAFDIGPGNTVNGKIPLRYQYPVNERSANAKNYNAAVTSQYSGSDDIYQAMWLIK
ncbi:MAG: SusD/RagB family nutrient-binding outer membrane lipoprotein [Mucilaginibacter sp.]